ncbi:MAG: endo alpha-1,4 polygalactosaminidase, partial [Anaerolineales bacterium]
MLRTTLILLFIGCLLLSACLPRGIAEFTSVASITPLLHTKIFLNTEAPIPSLASLTPTPKPSLPLPPEGYLYHGVYPGGKTGEESDLTIQDLQTYEQAAGKSVAWVYFSHNWYESRHFPIQTSSWIRAKGSVPYIRLMLRSSAETDVAEPLYTLQAILDGEFDPDIHQWCATASQFSTPLLAEYGTEVNGRWFSWNGVWNGGDKRAGYGDPTQPDGPERFRDAYRHIIQICREAQATNIKWVFHLNGDDWPEASWNHFENYYPGDEWIDWIGVSIYAAQSPLDDYWNDFRAKFDAVYPRIIALAPQKPLIVAEFGAPKNNPLGDQAEWARSALIDLTAMRWNNLIGFSWWNERWQNDDNPDHDTSMRLQDNPQLEEVFQQWVGKNPQVIGGSSSSSAIYLPLVTHQTFWHPKPGITWQIQFSGDVNLNVDAEIYDLDLFETEKALINGLHQQGKKVICYFSAGSWEDWRPDAKLFPPEVIGKDYFGWQGEKWLDIRQIEYLAPILRARLDLCKIKGFDGVDADNVDGYNNDTGFAITADDQITFNRWLAQEAHQRGLSLGLKNDPEQAAQLEPVYDWSVTESCFSQSWCGMVAPFLSSSKPVFAIEYTDEWDVQRFQAQICTPNLHPGISVILKHRELDG